MPSKPKNKFKEFSINGTNKTLKVFQLECPWPVRIATIQNSSKLIKIESFDYSQKNELIKKAKEDGYEIEVDPLTFEQPELCPKCKKKGIPSFQLKSNTYSYSKESNESGDLITDNKRRKTVKIHQEKTWWLRFHHPNELKKHCWVEQYQGSINGTFKKKKWKNDIDINLHLIGGTIRYITNSIQK